MHNFGDIFRRQWRRGREKMEISLAMAELAIKITARSQKTPDARPNKPASVAAMGGSAMATVGCNLC